MIDDLLIRYFLFTLQERNDEDLAGDALATMKMTFYGGKKVSRRR